MSEKSETEILSRAPLLTRCRHRPGDQERGDVNHPVFFRDSRS
jgi:hypothetical protein